VGQGNWCRAIYSLNTRFNLILSAFQNSFNLSIVLPCAPLASMLDIRPCDVRRFGEFHVEHYAGTMPDRKNTSTAAGPG
jgi:hypothetical protein